MGNGKLTMSFSRGDEGWQASVPHALACLAVCPRHPTEVFRREGFRASDINRLWESDSQ